ncbi:MAG: divergent polysaccharide deacetylase family protein [Gammaproteobacteria bacterium]
MTGCTKRMAFTTLGPLLAGLLLSMPADSRAGEQVTTVPGNRPSIALIIDDLGNRLVEGERAVQLPGPVACAFLPYGPFTRQLAQQAHAHRKEVMLHLPMQSVAPDVEDQGELTLDMTQRQFVDTLQRDMAAVPHLDGINNHRGSLLTRHPGHMAWLMQVMRSDPGLFFVDSRTTAATVARQLAGEYGVPSIERKVFLDNVRDSNAVSEQFRRLLDFARREGTALGIGHPHPETLAVLAQELSRMDDYNIQIVPVSRLIEIRNGGNLPWQASLSR